MIFGFVCRRMSATDFDVVWITARETVSSSPWESHGWSSDLSLSNQADTRLAQGFRFVRCVCVCVSFLDRRGVLSGTVGDDQMNETVLLSLALTAWLWICMFWRKWQSLQRSRNNNVEVLDTFFKKGSGCCGLFMLCISPLHRTVRVLCT